MYNNLNVIRINKKHILHDSWDLASRNKTKP